jgi:chromosome segregation and condensation protein ScpB
MLTFGNRPTRIDNGLWWYEIDTLSEMQLIRYVKKDPNDPLTSLYVITELGRLYVEFPNLPAPEIPEADF